MTMSDPIADMLTRIRNANTAKHDTVDVPSSKMKLAIADILLEEGYIKKYDLIDEGNFKTIRITLKYGADRNDKIISGMVMGRINKELKEICLLDQVYVKAEDGKQSVAQYVAQVAKESGANIELKSFVRFETGEGLEKKNEDFAAEVAAQMNA